MPWRRAYVMAEMGNADGIFVFVRTLEREKDFYFTDAIFQTGYGVFARKSSKLAFASAKDLAGFTVAAYGPSGTSIAAEELVKNANGMRLEIEVDNQVVMRKLDAGRYTEPAAAFMNRDVGNWLIAQQKFNNVKLTGEAKKVDYCIGLSRKRVTPEQVDKINQALRELAKKGVIKSIAEKHGLKAAS
jgi:polar amino acid transport system substrate-binding protein